MSELITLSKLSALMSESSGIELSVCEAFIRNLTQTVISGLAEGEHIRIKDFGFFELRQSPDNTDVAFVPESSFAERVNTQYAHLRPAAATTNAPWQQPETPQPQANTPVPQQQTPNAPYVPQQTEPNQPFQPAPQQQMPNAPYVPQQTEPNQTFQPAPQQQMPNAPYVPQQKEPNQTFQPAPQQQMPGDVAEYMSMHGPGQPKQEEDTHSSSYSSYSSRNIVRHDRKLPQLSTNKKFVLIGVMGLITGLFIGYLAGRNSSFSDYKKEAASVENTADDSSRLASAPVSQEFDYETAVNVADVDTLMDDVIDDEMDDDTSEPPHVEKNTDVLKVKLQKGQRLSDIAKKYYGKKEYWVYIYLDNREIIGNPFTVREGVVLNIPPKDKYAPTTNENSNYQWAKAKAAEINKKFERN